MYFDITDIGNYGNADEAIEGFFGIDGQLSLEQGIKLLNSSSSGVIWIIENNELWCMPLDMLTLEDIDGNNE